MHPRFFPSLPLLAVVLSAGCYGSPDQQDGPVGTAAQDISVQDLCIVTGSDAQAGTSASVSLTWLQSDTTWRCDVQPRDPNTMYCCTPSNDGTSLATGYFGINPHSGDGVQIAEAWADSSDTGGYYADRFTDTGKYCSDWDSSSLAYKQCWVDSEGHGSCGHLKLGADAWDWSPVSFSCQSSTSDGAEDASMSASLLASGACGVLSSGMTLARNQSVRSCDSRFTLDMQGDGNLVLYMGSQALWATGTNGSTTATQGSSAVLQGDGNFVVYNSTGSPLWATGTNNRPTGALLLQNDGNLVLYRSDGTASYWASGTSGH